MKLEKLLKILSFTSFAFLFFAPTLFLSRLSAENGHFVVLNIPLFKSLICFLGIFVVCYLGFFAGLLVNRFRKAKKHLALINLLPIFIGVISFSLFSAMFFKISVSFFSLLALSFVCFYFSYKKAFLTYHEIINFNLLFMGACLSVLIIFFFALSKAQYHPNSLIIPFFISVSGYAIIRNQANIDEIMERGHHNKKHLPLTVRRYSFWFVSSVLSLGFVAIFFRKFFAKIVVFFGQLIKIILKGFALVVEFLTNLLFSGDEGKKQVLPPPEKEDFLPKEEASHTLSGYIIIAIVAIIAIFLLIKYREEIIKGILSTFRKFYKKLNLFFNNSKTVNDKSLQNGKYYYDETETVKAEKVKEEVVHNLSFHRWKKQIKTYRSIKDNSQKFRFGYNLTLLWLETRGAKINSADTPLEILEKSQKYLCDVEFVAITNLYNKVRYNDSFLPTDKDLMLLSDTLKFLTGHFK